MSELFTELPIGKFFETQVEKQPDHEFIVYPDRNLRFTYKEFNEKIITKETALELLKDVKEEKAKSHKLKLNITIYGIKLKI